MVAATLTSKGQITVPAPVRRRLDLQEGDRIEFIENNDGDYIIRPLRQSVKRLEGYLGHWTGPHITTQDMNDAIIQAACESSK